MATPIINSSDIHLYHPAPNSRKGDNGRLLVIGGSKLFHSSIFWSADIASRIVDLVHFTSPANENNELVRKKLKMGFWSGIVVEWGDVEHYIEEDDCVLIGPGMVRKEGPRAEGRGLREENSDIKKILLQAAEEDDTTTVVNSLLRKYPNKKWVIDGGALQEVDPHLINANMIVTPNLKEFNILSKKCVQTYSDSMVFPIPEQVSKLSETLRGSTIVLKGQEDIICQGDRCVLNKTGNEGMTKGGTGDVLAGLVVALYCNNDAWTAATAGAYVNGTAGDRLQNRVGVYYNAGDLVGEIPKTLNELTHVTPPARHSQ